MAKFGYVSVVGHFLPQPKREVVIFGFPPPNPATLTTNANNDNDCAVEPLNQQVSKEASHQSINRIDVSCQIRNRGSTESNGLSGLRIVHAGAWFEAAGYSKTLIVYLGWRRRFSADLYCGRSLELDIGYSLGMNIC